MKPIAFALLIAGAGLATVNAVPIRVTVISSGPDILVPHILPVNHDNFNAVPNGVYQAFPPPEIRRPCSGMRNKAVKFSDFLRNMFGLSPFVGTPQHIEHYGPFISASRPPQVHAEPIVHIRPPGLAGFEDPLLRNSMEHHHKVHRHHKSFPKRIMHAFKTLKWWEGGVVAFVFGCGIGVLLRLFWVLAVVSYRVVVKGESAVSNESVHEEEETVPFIPPPLYAEKAPILEDKKVDESA